jgi:hypothetical protein
MTILATLVALCIKFSVARVAWAGFKFPFDIVALVAQTHRCDRSRAEQSLVAPVYSETLEVVR